MPCGDADNRLCTARVRPLVMTWAGRQSSRGGIPAGDILPSLMHCIGVVLVQRWLCAAPIMGKQRKI